MGTQVSKELAAYIFRAKSKLKMEAADSSETVQDKTYHVSEYHNISLILIAKIPNHFNLIRSDLNYYRKQSSPDFSICVAG
jgi:hypothetical protein